MVVGRFFFQDKELGGREKEGKKQRRKKRRAKWVSVWKDMNPTHPHHYPPTYPTRKTVKNNPT